MVFNIFRLPLPSRILNTLYCMKGHPYSVIAEVFENSDLISPIPVCTCSENDGTSRNQPGRTDVVLIRSRNQCPYPESHNIRRAEKAKERLGLQRSLHSTLETIRSSPGFYWPRTNDPLGPPRPGRLVLYLACEAPRRWNLGSQSLLRHS